MQVAIGANHIEAVKRVLKEDPQFITKSDKDGRTCLHIAVYNGQRDLVELFIKKGADVNAQTIHGKTPLHYAIMLTGDSVLPIIQTLLKNGANPFLMDFYGNSVLDFFNAVRSPLTVAIDREIETLFNEYMRSKVPEVSGYTDPFVQGSQV